MMRRRGHQRFAIAYILCAFCRWVHGVFHIAGHGVERAEVFKRI